MSISEKYGRTYHYSFSKGTTSDDRINENWYSDMCKLESIIDLEKMDGENNCMNGIGIFARSHAAPTTNPWCDFLKPKFGQIKSDLKAMNIEIFGENLYATHSIQYPNLDEHYKIFAVRHLDKWLGWEEVKWYADVFDFHTVPEIRTYVPSDFKADEIEKFVLSNSDEPSVFGSQHLKDGIWIDCSKEGIVSRNFNEFPTGPDSFKSNVFKNVRKGHVQTDVHWVRNWKRAPLITDTKTNTF